MPKLLIPALLAAAATGAAAQDTALVVIAATADVHGAAAAWDYVADRPAPWGLTRAATVIDSLRRAHPGQVVLLDAGDLLQGGPLPLYFATVRPRETHPLVDLLNAMGYDAITPGDHDFDFGVDVLGRAFGGAGFPVVSGNIFRLPRDTFAFAPHVLLPRGPVRVGVTGFTTPAATAWHRAALRGRLAIRPILPAAENALRQLRGAGADLAVAVVHSGMGGPSAYDTAGVGPEHSAAGLAGLRTRPDLVIVGHSHRHFADSVVNGVHFVQPQAGARSLAVVKVRLTRSAGGREGGRGWRVAGIESREIPLANVPPLPALVERLRQPHEAARNWASRPIATTEGDWRAREARVRDTPLLDFVNAVQQRTARAHLSAVSIADVDHGFPSGPVRVRDVIGFYPDEFTLKAVRIDGARLRRYLEHAAAYFRTWQAGGPVLSDSVPGDRFDAVSGVAYEIDLTRPVGSRIRGLSYQGRLVTDQDEFVLALSSYRQAGGGGYDMLAGLPVVYDAGQKVRDLLLQAAEAADVLRAREHLQDSWRLVPGQAQQAAIETFSPPPPPRDTALLRVVATGNVRGALESQLMTWSAGRRVAGAAATKAWMDSLARACGCPTIRLDAGDALAGTAVADLFNGRAVIDAYNAMEYDAATVGDYEFSWTTDTLAARVAGSRFPWLAANVGDTTGQGRASWARNWIMVERGGRRIGIVGLATASPTDTVNPLDVARLTFEDPRAALKRLLPAVRDAGAEFIIVLAHGGRRCDPDCQDEPIADELPPGAVDLVITGHGSGRVRATAAGIPLVQVGHPGEVAVVDLVRRAGGYLEARLRVDTVWADRVTPDTAVRRIVARYAAETERTLGRRVAALKVPAPLEGRRGGEALGRLVADAFRHAGRSDAALVLGSALHAGLPGGPVNYGQARAVLPHSARLVRLTVSGDTLLRALEHAVSGQSPIAHVSGVTIRYDPRGRPGRRIREARLADGRPIQRRTRYSLTVSEALAAGGAGFKVLAGPGELLGMLDLEALVRFLGVLPQPVDPPESPRVVPTR
ncbi:MAG TPA: 5'-nucleotidase C-terminal domain-containing protein [Gemmatimonadales bacterium]|nr:5'-nucleotidase C-terminal domain-containing protein [Gemmatimonadales bacterium]